MKRNDDLPIWLEIPLTLLSVGGIILFLWLVGFAMGG